MTQVEAILLLLAVTTLLVAVARRIGIPYPILLVIGGLGIGVTPWIPNNELKPEYVFVLILPPILQSAAFFTPVRDFRTHLRSILSLAVGLVLVSTVVVAAVAHLVVDGLSWPAAFVLGAIVSPPDAVAATSVAERLGLPRWVVSILEGESLVNDATALVALRVATAAAVTGHFSLGEALWDFVTAAGFGIVVGLVVGWVVVELLVRIRDNSILIATTLLAPYAAYLAAEELFHASGVLAVVVAGLLMGRGFFRLPDPSSRLQAGGFWSMFIFLLNGFVFILIGAQLPEVIDRIEGIDRWTLAGYAAAVSATAIAVRFAWVFLTSDPALRIRRAISCFEQPERADRRELAVIGWAGMRGVVSLAAALALEPDVPGRDLILFLTFAVILVTLVLQGLTLAPLTRWLGVTGDGEEALEDLEARTAMAIAARRRLEELSSEPWTLDHIVEDLALHLDTRVSGLRAKSDDDQDGPSQETERLADIGRKLQRELIQAELTEAIRLRDAGRINDTTLRGLQRDLDVERVRLERV